MMFESNNMWLFLDLSFGAVKLHCPLIFPAELNLTLQFNRSSSMDSKSRYFSKEGLKIVDGLNFIFFNVSAIDSW